MPAITNETVLPKISKTGFARLWVMMLAIGVLTALCIAAYIVLTYGSISTDEAQIDGRLVPVSPKVSAYVSEQLVNDNQLVKHGQVIARIDSRDAKAAGSKQTLHSKMRRPELRPNFKETQLRSLRPGNRVEITVDQHGRTFAGRIDPIANAMGSRLTSLPPANAPGNYLEIVQRIPVKIVRDFEAVSAEALDVGASADVTVHTL
jgi:multidrug resistance efflux pump